MAKLSLSVRIAASSIFVLGLFHTIFWAAIAFWLQPDIGDQFPAQTLRPVLLILSAAGLAGIFISIGLFRARNWSRIAAIALAAFVVFFCALGIVAPLFFFFGLAATTGVGVELPSKNDLLRFVLVYATILTLAIWWIVLFSRKSVAAQFSSRTPLDAPAVPRKTSCPPPIALLAWLMIASSALCVVSWPLILGKIPAMLFTYIFSPGTSKWIWAVNILLFLACGIGLLKLQRWSYTGAIALHAFWLVSMFVSQCNPLSDKYLELCLNALAPPDTFFHVGYHIGSRFASAVITAIPTALLIAGLFYYRRSFLKAVEDSRHGN